MTHQHLAIATDVRVTWHRNDIAGAVYVAHVALNAAGGLTLLCGGAQGITTPSLAVIQETIGHVWWGAGLLTASALLVAAAAHGARAVVTVLALLSLAHLLVAASVLGANLAAPPGPPFPAPYGVDVFCYPAAIIALSAVPYWRCRGRTDA